ncbi:hypothetical protein AB0F17_28675 [Nonomuraea sp. NPDC026600]|uniref:hypothetical protein n=1 Tax=Nonomuraea sp. NPDC026600 TaxID=3155363 RepID=UPI00340564C5
MPMTGLLRRVLHWFCGPVLPHDETAHTEFGFCSECPDSGPYSELLRWRMRQQVENARLLRELPIEPGADEIGRTS